MSKHFNQGDTIVELMVAFAIFTIAAISTIAILNQGLSTTERSIEDTLVRQQIDSQAEIIRYLSETDSTIWKDILAKSVASPVSINIETTGSIGIECPNIPSGAFIVYLNSGGDFAINNLGNSLSFTKTPDTYAFIDYSSPYARSQGIWMQVTKVPSVSVGVAGDVDAYDFYIHGCWYSVGSGAPSTLGTIVRIYDNK